MRRRKRQRRSHGEGSHFSKPSAGLRTGSTGRHTRPIYRHHSSLSTFPLLLASRLTFFVVLLAEVADRQAAGCLEDVSGGEGSVGPPSFFFARFRGELKEEGEDWDSNGVMSGW